MRGVLATLMVLMTSNAEAAVPVIYRGSSVAAAPSAPDLAPVAVAGRRLWLVDPDRREVTGCAVERTTRIGQRRIRCTGGSLP